jgi:hypothetical protein
LFFTIFFGPIGEKGKGFLNDLLILKTLQLKLLKNPKEAILFLKCIQEAACDPVKSY